MLNRYGKLFVILGLMFAFSEATFSQGIIIPRPCPPVRRCPMPPRPAPLPKALPVKSIEINTSIKGQVATTSVTQIFKNDLPYIVEGTYLFPIPETASIEEFAIWENGKKLVGEVRSREEARRIYDEIVRSMRDPGLLEYAGKDLFQASIFPIAANSEKKLELRYSEILKAESGTVAYRYPLGTGKMLWQQPGPPMPLPVLSTEKGSAVSNSGEQEFGTVSGSISIEGTEAIRNIFSPTHELEVIKNGENSAKISFETNGSAADFELFYGLSNKEFGMSLMTYREPGKDGYFLFIVSPKDQISSKMIVNKDVVFVIDTSGSMADDGKIEKARPALNFGINSLNEGDRFNVIDFAGEEHLMSARLISADRAGKQKGKSYVDKLLPTGGTNINDSLIAALRQFDDSDRPKMLVFLTDGRPTIGEKDIDKIVKNAQGVKVQGVRLFTFGVGYDVNTRLLDKLSAENSGVSDYVQPKEDLEIKVSSFFEKVNYPVLSNVTLDFGSIKTDLMYPRKITDIFKGTQTVVTGRYKNDVELRNAVITLSGKSGGEAKSLKYENLDFPIETTKNKFLPRLWASRRVGWLIEEIRTNGESKELKDELIELGTRYGIVTPYTSYLATDGSYVPRRVGNADLVIANKESGRDAVNQSVQQRLMKENTRVTMPRVSRGSSGINPDITENEIFVNDTLQNRFVGTKNFLNKEGNWVDVDYKPEANLPEVKIKFLSNEYLELVNKNKVLAEYFAISKNVVVVWNNTVYRVTE
ncbi:MAG: VIT and vWA domain-containing protein [Pyrinomonadaceae bacterium]